MRRALKAWRDADGRRAAFASLRKAAARILGRADLPRDAKLAALCALLHRRVPHYDWVGFYLVDPARPRELVLGPFEGERTEHVRIPFGRGVCGRAAATGRTLVIDDVGAESNYLACSLKVKSEIVAPIVRDGAVRAELDIDSHTRAAFGEDDATFLEHLCAAAAFMF
ncbi:MAG TPA: hypothetical protein DCM87_06930 [Planctomycetes bacterium]|jgi:GAF domain-containing protein|nr:hypothetical protein [Planctomycetota bacterium]